jgi:NitT/TauT family transport system substrate-binding protein
MKLRIMVSRHSAFYSPLIATIAKGFDASYGILAPGQRSQDLIRNGQVDIMQSAVSANWRPMERMERALPVHFALINRRDGFYLAGREADASFQWKKLEGRALMADHGAQPLAMLRYAAERNGVDWGKIQVMDRGTPEEMFEAFGRGEGDYLHRQAPGPGLALTSVGASMPEVAFSTLCCAREFVGSERYERFLGAYVTAREWVRSAHAGEVAALEASFFRGVRLEALAAAIRAYQQLGTWDGGIEIDSCLYEQALNVFEFAGAIEERHPYRSVCL